MGEIGQAEGWLVLAQATKCNASALHHSHMSRAHLLWNVVTWVAVTCGRFLPHTAPNPCGNISLTTQQPFTGNCCTAGSGHTDWKKLHNSHMMENCWWDKEGRKPFQLNNTLFFSFHHTLLLSAYSLSLASHEEWKCLHLPIFTA